VQPLKPLLVPAALALAVAVLLGWGLICLNRPDHKYRLTVEVQTPDGVRSASGVMAVYQGKISGPLPEAVAGISMKGDAVYVDLGGGRNLVAILNRGATLAMDAFAAVGQKVPFTDVKKLRGGVRVYGDAMPTLVAFTDPTDPKTARVLDPGNIEATFGRGYHLQRVALEMVSVGLWPLDFGGPLGEPITLGIEKRLRWVTSVEGYLSGRVGCNPSVDPCLEVGQFRRR
jgi:hypothetical protein